jgi:hypothetical protein
MHILLLLRTRYILQCIVVQSVIPLIKLIDGGWAGQTMRCCTVNYNAEEKVELTRLSSQRCCLEIVKPASDLNTSRISYLQRGFWLALKSLAWKSQLNRHPLISPKFAYRFWRIQKKISRCRWPGLN